MSLLGTTREPGRVSLNTSTSYRQSLEPSSILDPLSMLTTAARSSLVTPFSKSFSTTKKMMPYSTAHSITYIFAKTQIKLFDRSTFLGPMRSVSTPPSPTTRVASGGEISEARYLGPYLIINNMFDTELAKRVAADSRLCWVWSSCLIFIHTLAAETLRF